METEEWERLNSLVNRGVVTLVPPGNNDDVYVITYARDNNGFIISNDFFADHIRKIKDSNIRKKTKDWIKENRCNFTFVNCDQSKLFMLNPNCILNSLLNEITTNNINTQSIFVSPQLKENHLWYTQQYLRPDLMITLPHIDSITKSIIIYGKQQKIIEVKLLLLARANSLASDLYYYDAMLDLQFILHVIDSNCSDAINMMNSIHPLISTSTS